jgi:hypothetical protein
MNIVVVQFDHPSFDEVVEVEVAAGISNRIVSAVGHLTGTNYLPIVVDTFYSEIDNLVEDKSSSFYEDFVEKEAWSAWR